MGGGASAPDGRDGMAAGDGLSATLAAWDAESGAFCVWLTRSGSAGPVAVGWFGTAARGPYGGITAHPHPAAQPTPSPPSPHSHPSHGHNPQPPPHPNRPETSSPANAATQSTPAARAHPAGWFPSLGGKSSRSVCQARQPHRTGGRRGGRARPSPTPEAGPEARQPRRPPAPAETSSTNAPHRTPHTTACGRDRASNTRYRNRTRDFTACTLKCRSLAMS